MRRSPGGGEPAREQSLPLVPPKGLSVLPTCPRGDTAALAAGGLKDVLHWW